MLPAEAPLHQHQHAEDRQRDPRQLLALQAFAKDEGAKNDGKKGLRLHLSDASPAGMPRPIAQNKKANWPKLMVRPCPAAGAADGRPGDKQQRREGDSIKRRPASISGGILAIPA